MEDGDLANKVSSLCLEFYDMLPNAKRLLKNSEWTILSAIVMERDGELDVVAMGTGTKCIGSLSLTPNGDILNDSHAEIIMRRAFVRFLLHQIKAKDSIFDMNANEKRFKLQENVKFHMFTTASPCGDASIYATSDNVGDGDEDEEKEPDEKKIRLSTSLPDGFTGAKLMFDEDVEDPMEQTEGKIRIKPGKGDRTLSLSCSDKIARWNIVGIQGCMLSSLIDPIYLTSLILADGTSFNRLAMERALWKRFMDTEKCLESPFKLHRPNLLIACNKMKFIFARNDKERVNPSSNSIIYSKLPDALR
jgi:tRNA-specific adenosine deaminase 1